MAIIISGDIILDDTIQVIDQYFGKMPAKPIPQDKRTAPAPIQNGISKTIVTHEGEESVLMAWRTVPNSHKDVHALT